MPCGVLDGTLEQERDLSKHQWCPKEAGTLVSDGADKVRHRRRPPSCRKRAHPCRVCVGGRLGVGHWVWGARQPWGAS